MTTRASFPLPSRERATREASGVRGLTLAACAMLFATQAIAQDRPARLLAGTVSIGHEDYPASARPLGEAGPVAVEISVSEEGRPRSCVASGPAMLARRTCEIALEQWRYDPAMAAGKPISSTARTTVRWTPPPDVTPRADVVSRRWVSPTPVSATFMLREDDYSPAIRNAGEQGEVGVLVSIAADGSVTACEIASSSGHARLDDRSCRIARNRWRFTPATLDGAPVPSTSRQTYVWRIEYPR